MSFYIIFYISLYLLYYYCTNIFILILFHQIIFLKNCRKMQNILNPITNYFRIQNKIFLFFTVIYLTLILQIILFLHNYHMSHLFILHNQKINPLIYIVFFNILFIKIFYNLIYTNILDTNFYFMLFFVHKNYY